MNAIVSTEKKGSSINPTRAITHLKLVLILTIGFLILKISTQQTADIAFSLLGDTSFWIYIICVAGLDMYFDKTSQNGERIRLGTILGKKSYITVMLFIPLAVADFVIFVIFFPNFVLSLGIISVTISYDVVFFLIMIAFSIISLYQIRATGSN